MKQLKFYDLKAKKSFVTDKYKVKAITTKSGKRSLALTKGPSGAKCARII